MRQTFISNTAQKRMFDVYADESISGPRASFDLLVGTGRLLHAPWSGCCFRFRSATVLHA